MASVWTMHRGPGGLDSTVMQGGLRAALIQSAAPTAGKTMSSNMLWQGLWQPCTWVIANSEHRQLCNMILSEALYTR